MRHNREIKARLSNWGATRRIVQQLATSRVGQQIQTDTYFVCRHGRLKLREIVGQTAQLIWYERPNTKEPKTSRYYLTDVSDATGVKASLAAAIGIRCTIKKRREIYLYRNVRIHLDRVDSLGEFLELEAVIGENDNWDDAERLLNDLIDRLQIESDNLLTNSYGEMLLS